MHAKWKYRAIHHVGDLQVGVWSNTVELMVGWGTSARKRIAADAEN
jgi:hypothetical protein